MGSYIGFVNDKTNGYVRPPTMIGLFNAEFLSSSHAAPGLMERFDVYAAVVGLLRKGREIPMSGR
jgi:phosphoenolpyruvate-protein kinase (PTS system EI component)